jgi:hypothetical protein
MATGGVVFLRPTIRCGRGSGAVVYLAHRQVAGIYSTALTNTSSRVKKHKKPSSLHPIGYIDGDKSKPVLIDEAWSRFLGLEIQGRKLGGTAYPTLPDLTEFILLSQQNATAVAQLQTTLEQMVIANAQTLQSVVEVTQTASLAGAAQIPPPVLVRQETSPPPLNDLQGGGDGGGGDGGGGGD